MPCGWPARLRANEGSRRALTLLLAIPSLDRRPIEKEVAKDSAQTVASQASDAPSCLQQRPLRKENSAVAVSSARVRGGQGSTRPEKAMTYKSILTACALLGATTIAAIAVTAQVRADEASRVVETPETLSTSRQAHGHAEEHVTLGQEESRPSARARATGDNASVAVTVSIERDAKSSASSRASSLSISTPR